VPLFPFHHETPPSFQEGIPGCPPIFDQSNSSPDLLEPASLFVKRNCKKNQPGSPCKSPFLGSLRHQRPWRRELPFMTSPTRFFSPSCLGLPCPTIVGVFKRQGASTIRSSPNAFLIPTHAAQSFDNPLPSSPSPAYLIAAGIRGRHGGNGYTPYFSKSPFF